MENKKNDHPGFCKERDCRSKECMWFQGRESWKETLYETKPFIVPNGGDIKEVSITYKDWIWIENFIRQEREALLKEILEEIKEKRKNERNMAQGEFCLETVGEVEAWNFALTEVLEIINKKI